MVRLKSRYILFEILYPSPDPRFSEDDSEPTVKDIMLQHHKTSPANLTTKSIVQELRKTLQYNFGDYGSGKATSLLQIKYFSNRTSTGIIRCSREDYELVVTALTLMNRIGDFDGIIINPVKISGTIKKIEQYAIRRNTKLLRILNRQDSVDNFETLISEDEVED
ncbi:LAFE_0D11452g1_1 [Lachancea fermentati]|uniref:Ribonuclease P/MRP protein subunit POP5 n=1 Tax=Lachancea fermentati TaxID=4955 RepID=A0A1G4MCG9_LACFM|nr:LAFE_0D11452g1_1 [Lachancea fermentati]